MQEVLGVPVRVHDMSGDDLGIAHVPTPVLVGDLVLLEQASFHVVDVVDTGQLLPIAALERVMLPMGVGGR